jgi:hypothetical protein
MKNFLAAIFALGCIGFTVWYYLSSPELISLETDRIDSYLSYVSEDRCLNVLLEDPYVSYGDEEIVRVVTSYCQGFYDIKWVKVTTNFQNWNPGILYSSNSPPRWGDRITIKGPGETTKGDSQRISITIPNDPSLIDQEIQISVQAGYYVAIGDGYDSFQNSFQENKVDFPLKIYSPQEKEQLLGLLDEQKKLDRSDLFRLFVPIGAVIVFPLMITAIITRSTKNKYLVRGKDTRWIIIIGLGTSASVAFYIAWFFFSEPCLWIPGSLLSFSVLIVLYNEVWRKYS